MPAPSSLLQLLKKLRHLLPYLRERYHVSSLRVFGAYVRGEQRPGSDLDILVTFDELPSLLGFIAIENYLSDQLGVKVDLVMEDTIKPPLEKLILKETVPV